MKSLLCAALCLAISLQVASAHDSSEEIKDCAEEHHIKAADMKLFFDGKEVPSPVKCFLKCVMMRFDTLKEDGTFDSSPLKEHDETLVPAADECFNKIDKNDDLCELAYQHSVCMREKIPSDKWKKEVLEQLE